MQGPESCLRQGPKTEMHDVAGGEVRHHPAAPPAAGRRAARVRGARGLGRAGSQGGERGSFVQRVDAENRGREESRHALDQPEAQVGHWGEDVIADVGASWLQRVAHKPLLLVLVDGGPGHDDHHHSQQDHEDKPDLPWKRGGRMGTIMERNFLLTTLKYVLGLIVKYKVHKHAF